MKGRPLRPRHDTPRLARGTAPPHTSGAERSDVGTEQTSERIKIRSVNDGSAWGWAPMRIN
jgi:hypothetical protein